MFDAETFFSALKRYFYMTSGNFAAKAIVNVEHANIMPIIPLRPASLPLPGGSTYNIVRLRVEGEMGMF